MGHSVRDRTHRRPSGARDRLHEHQEQHATRRSMPRRVGAAPTSSDPAGVRAAQGTVSIIIPVRDRQHALNESLRAVARQTLPPLEVIIVDDGSRIPVRAPGFEHGTMPCAIRVIRQIPLGIAAARNAGAACARGELLLFTDSDCLLHPSCVAELRKEADAYPADKAFQLRIVSSDVRLVWRIENLMLMAKLSVLVAPDGHIGFANTSGFAIRATTATKAGDVFRPEDIRGSDTSLLAALYRQGVLPRFVSAAVVEHRPVLHLCRYLIKRAWAGYHTGPARCRLRRVGLPTLSTRQRFSGLHQAARLIRYAPGQAGAFLAMVVAYGMELCGRAAFAVVGMRPGASTIQGIRVDHVNATDIQTRVLQAGASGRPMLLTYLTAWTLVQAQRSREFGQLLGRFDLRYADGMGVGLAVLLLELRRVHKVTANDFFVDLCREAAARQLSVGLLGGEEGVVDALRSRLQDAVPALRIVFTAHGFHADAELENQVRRLEETRPRIVFVGMGQPLQERMALSLAARLHSTVFFCVGGLFDYMTGRNATPPMLIRRFGFEWLWRLVHSPRRLWKRYVIGLPLLGLFLVHEHLRRFAVLSNAILSPRRTMLSR